MRFMFCPKCGKELRDGASFCNQCGASLQETPITVSEPNNVLMKNDSAYSRPIQTVAIMLSAIALLFALLPRIIGYVNLLDAIVFAIIPGITMLIFCCRLSKINPIFTGIPKAFVLLAEVISFLIYGASLASPVSPILPLLSAVLYFYAFSNKETTRKIFRIITTVIICVSTILSIVNLIRQIHVAMRLNTDYLFILEIIANSVLLILLMFGNKSKVVEEIKTNDNVYNVQNRSISMFCPNCGVHFLAGKRFCDQCGSELKEVIGTSTINSQRINGQDAPSTGFAVLGFFFPVVGLILYLVWKDTMPLRAKSTGKGALAGAITGVALTILIYVVYFIIIAILF